MVTDRIDKTRIARVGGAPVYAEDCDVTPNEELRDLIDKWGSGVQANNPVYERARQDLLEVLEEYGHE